MAKAILKSSTAKRLVRGARLAEAANRSGRRARRIATSVAPGSDFAGHGRITAAAAIGGESNRWSYTLVITVEDDAESVLTYVDTEEEVSAQNLAEEHNQGTGQESNGVTVGASGGATVTLIPIMTGRVVRLYRRRYSSALYFDTPNDVSVSCS